MNLLEELVLWVWILLILTLVFVLIGAILRQHEENKRFDPCTINENVTPEVLWNFYPECVILQQEKGKTYNISYDIT